MAKITPKYDFKKDGSKNIKGYSVSLTKTECEKNGFNNEVNIEIRYSLNKIEIIKKED